MEKNKTTQIQFRVSEQEKAEIREKAKSLNLKLSEYILSLHKRKSLPLPPSNIERQQLKQVAQIGNTLNQLLVIVQSGKVPDSEDMQLVIKAISLFIKIHELKR
ncbi:plasmid mobilization protein [Endozoicomonas sp.]|uniref:plasmid mobilization protein n=1 Tax=Endozoicomonas sp. TaxID=1892382 RepID=UPI003AF552EE